MKEKELKILIIVFIVIIVSSASFIFLRPFFQVEVSFNPSGKPLPKVEASLASSKIMYQNNERVFFEVKIKTDKSLENATLHLYGIEGKNGKFIIDQSKSLNLKANEDNLIEFVIRLPNCFSCAGIDTGTYPIKLEVIKDNKIIGSSLVEISLVEVK